MQWHVTDRCNLRCSHCYQETYSGEEMDKRALLQVLEGFKDLQDLPRFSGDDCQRRAHVNVTGGEPFVREDLFDLLEALHGEGAWLSYGVLTNGTLVDEEVVRRLVRLRPSMVQVSIEGNASTHDSIRGAGTFEKALGAIKAMSRAGLWTVVSFTAHRGNFREFPDVARWARRAGARKVWTDRLLPFGAGSAMSDLTLTPEETREFFDLVHVTQRKIARWRSSTFVRMDRGLQFLVGTGLPYRCSAGDTLVTVMPNGDVLPCRRMPIVVGNLLEEALPRIYEGSPFLNDLREPERVPEGCETCNFLLSCKGGSRCISYAVHGDPFKADPGCWLASSGPSFTCDCLEVREYDSATMADTEVDIRG
jgi:radical SAM protein with 4Fe4S-binding SPASM domain